MRLDGKKTAEEIRLWLKEEIAKKAGRPPSLTVFLVGEHESSQVYVRNKRRACQEVGIGSILEEHPSTISEEALLDAVRKRNADPEVDGILVQLPLPSHISARKVIETVSPEKDVDGFHPLNLGKLLQGRQDGFVACTPLGIRVLLDAYDISTEGKHAVVVGRSEIVGKPLAVLLMQKSRWGNATVTVAHSQTKGLEAITRQGDLLIAAMGSPRFIKKEMVKEGAVVVDVGTNPESSTEGKRTLAGDVDFEAVEGVCSAITPVPGGVGPMTIAMLLSNTWKSYCLREGVPVSQAWDA